MNTSLDHVLSYPRDIPAYLALAPSTIEACIDDARYFKGVLFQATLLKNLEAIQKCVKGLSHIRYRQAKLSRDPQEQDYVLYYESELPLLKWDPFETPVTEVPAPSHQPEELECECPSSNTEEEKEDSSSMDVSCLPTTGEPTALFSADCIDTVTSNDVDVEVEKPVATDDYVVANQDRSYTVDVLQKHRSEQAPVLVQTFYSSEVDSGHWSEEQSEMMVTSDYPQCVQVYASEFHGIHRSSVKHHLLPYVAVQRNVVEHGCTDLFLRASEVPSWFKLFGGDLDNDLFKYHNLRCDTSLEYLSFSVLMKQVVFGVT